MEFNLGSDTYQQFPQISCVPPVIALKIVWKNLSAAAKPNSFYLISSFFLGIT